jgi:hypothetical protein
MPERIKATLTGSGPSNFVSPQKELKKTSLLLMSGELEAIGEDRCLLCKHLLSLHYNGELDTTCDVCSCRS